MLLASVSAAILHPEESMYLMHTKYLLQETATMGFSRMSIRTFSTINMKMTSSTYMAFVAELAGGAVCITLAAADRQNESECHKN